MVRQNPPSRSGSFRLLLPLVLCGIVVSAGLTPAADIDWQQRQDMLGAIRTWIQKNAKGKNEDGVDNQRAAYSRTFRPAAEGKFLVTVHVDTALDGSVKTQRYDLTVGRGASGWEVTDAKVVDEYVGLFRRTATSCEPFQALRFDREGLKITASKGELCRFFTEGEMDGFGVHAADLRYEYSPPEHVTLSGLGHDFYKTHKLVAEAHANELVFPPAAVLVECDKTSCQSLLESSFTGVEPTVAAPSNAQNIETASSSWADPLFRQTEKSRKENAFAGFSPPTPDGQRYYAVLVLRDLEPLSYPGFDQTLPGSGIALNYNNWGGYEVQLTAFPRRYDLPGQIVGSLYGYYSEETIANSEPYELERRPDPERFWTDVFSLKGTVAMGVENDQMIAGDVEFGITLNQDLREVPFEIAGYDTQTALGGDRPPVLFVNSIQLEGKELTWVRTGSRSGVVVLPEEMPAGSKIKLRMNFETQAIRKVNHAFSAVARFGWLPFVSFGDLIQEFELEVHSPAQYEILGVGHKVSEETKGDVLISRWKADTAVAFPTIIFGRYQSDRPRFDALKSDQTKIPVEVHVDQVSFADWDIRPGQLRPIAEQAANAINLYREISGLDYPYGELNLVNDPFGFLYGQAPSSLIYLGSGVFRGEGAFQDASASKFLKSVTAHEVGHQWWGSRITNANTRNYWFVESLAEYFSAIFLEAVFGPKEYQEQVDEWRRNILEANLKASVQDVRVVWGGETAPNTIAPYTAGVYNKGPYAFHMLREIFRGQGPPGPDGADKKFFEALKKMSQELAAKGEIVTRDIQTALEGGLGGVGPDGQPYKVDLNWFFDQWIRGAGIPQYKFVHAVRQNERGEFLVSGTIEQRVVIGSARDHDVLPNTYYRSRVPLYVKTSDGKEYSLPVLVEGASTPFQLPPLPAKPVVVELNRNGSSLALDTVTTNSW